MVKGNRKFSVDRGTLWLDIIAVSSNVICCMAQARGWGFASGFLIYNQQKLEETLNISEFQFPHL